MIRVLIVDDEPYARDELALLLGQDADIDLLGQAANAIEALGLINRLKPDVVFLDIQMPKLSGMELVAMLDPLPRIVFVTAYDSYAIQAFEEQAFDYLLKPVEPVRLHKTLARLKQDMTPQPMAALAPAIHHIPGYLHNRVRLLPMAQVEYAFSDLGGVHVACQGELFHTQLTLKSLEEKSPLLRCHRQYLIHPAAIFEIALLDNQLAEIVTPSGARVPVSRRYLKALKDQFGLN
ncbi:two-component system response regulator BtsR [Aeromonas molluscorum]|jgi:two-component system, LytTR family, response regulator|uniref:Two-component response-regulatory protein YehT n=1 Tax=Aeromonas molluscorum 848 TaxID=1268236 RepID=R1F4D2_9GAMM|nr:two-component system response regulator BtsR [Aeromonas molluscorum]EOD54687.1 two-component response-regulatory protein YehT [Aeromonas molluscorum 848]